jgi:hypothetical protein
MDQLHASSPSAAPPAMAPVAMKPVPTRVSAFPAARATASAKERANPWFSRRACAIPH